MDDDLYDCESQVNFFGLSPFRGEWTALHDILVRENAGFLGVLDRDEREDFLAAIDSFLQHRAAKLGFTRRLLGNVSRWVPPVEKVVSPPSGDAGVGAKEPDGKKQYLPPPPLSDVHMLATSFAEDQPDNDLRLFLRDIHPTLSTSKGSRDSAANDALALELVVRLLADRAGQCQDTDAFKKAMEIRSSLAPLVSTMACRGADDFEKSRTGGATPRRLKGLDDELTKCASALLASGISRKNLTAKIVERFGEERFGGKDHVRRRLQGLGLIPKRPDKKAT